MGKCGSQRTTPEFDGTRWPTYGDCLFRACMKSAISNMLPLAIHKYDGNGLFPCGSHLTWIIAYHVSQVYWSRRPCRAWNHFHSSSVMFSFGGVLTGWRRPRRPRYSSWQVTFCYLLDASSNLCYVPSTRSERD